MLMSRHKNGRQGYNLLTANKCFENVSNFKYLSKTNINIAFMKKLKADKFRGMLDTIQFRIFCLTDSSVKIEV
jgi:hypothetical protein